MQKQEAGIYLRIEGDKCSIIPGQKVAPSILKGKTTLRKWSFPNNKTISKDTTVIGVKSFVISEGSIYIGSLYREMITKNILQKNEFTSHFSRVLSSIIPKETFLDRITKSYPVPEANSGFYVDRDIWFFLIRQILRKKQVLLTGASGTGKTEMVYHMLSYLKGKGIAITPETFDMAVQNPEASFKGQVHVENGKSFFKYARFAKKIQQKETLILLDEFNRGDIATQNILMPVLDKRRMLYVERGDKKEIQVHESTFFWATANIGYSFSGTSQIDEAVSQRFQIIKIDYPPFEKEAQVLMVRTGISQRLAYDIVEFANKIRESTIFQKKPSLRMLLETAELVKDGYSKSLAIQYSIQNQITGNDPEMVDTLNKLI